MNILVLNAGSSSQKLRLYEISNQTPPPETPASPLWAADAAWGHTPDRMTVTLSAGGRTWQTEEPAGPYEDILTRLLQALWQGQAAVLQHPSEIARVGHRIVHGGAQYHTPTLITPEVLDGVRQLVPIAPLHQATNLAGIAVIARLFGQIPQIAVFDTAYHHYLPLVAQVYPGPYAWFEQGMRRYGFHGISHQYCARRSAQLLGRPISDLRMVTCHLGNGCSLAAIRAGQSIDTTMGFTPLEGLMMGSRSGSIDPGLLLYLQREQDLTPQTVEHILNDEAGLKGISGFSGDMRAILQASAQGHERARLALDLYIYRLRTSLGSMIAALEGVDVVTFTGGVGEHVPEVRARVCQGFRFLGMAVDEQKNAAVKGDQDISSANSAIRVLVVHTEEDWEIARACWQMHAGAPSEPGI